MDDKQLILLLKEFPSQGLEAAIDLYGSKVKWIAQKILGTDRESDVEECVSDVFLKLWQSIYRYDSESGAPLKSYLYGIARHTALDYRRRLCKTEEWIPLEENDLGIQVNFEEQMAAKENRKILQAAVDDLGEPDREIFLFRYYLGQSVSEIAGYLDLTSKAVENRLYRGKKRLREILLERGMIR